MTDEKAPLTEEEQKQIAKFFKNLANDKCPHCGAIIEKKDQDGRCVYAKPCGHRLYQGTLPKEKK